MAVWAQVIDGASVVDGAIFTKDVGFQAHAVGIDNYTPYYIYLKDADCYIAPFWVGAIRVLMHTTDYAYVTVASPFGAQGVLPGGYFIHLVWTDSKEVQQTPGSSIGGTGGVTPPVSVTVTGQPISVTVAGLISAGELIQYDSNVFTVGLVAIAVPIVFTVDRRAVLLQSSKYNNPAATIYIGGPTVTANDGAKGGIQLSPGMSYPMDLAEQAIPYAITDIASRPYDSIAGQRLIVAEAR